MFPSDTRILIIDDMKIMRSAIKEHLKTLGFSNFLDADNGENGFNLLNAQYEKDEPIQLVCSDWNMPVMTGIELLRKVRSTPHFANLPFLMITAEREDRNADEAASAGVSAFIKKPFTTPALQEKILSVWKKHHT